MGKKKKTVKAKKIHKVQEPLKTFVMEEHQSKEKDKNQSQTQEANPTQKDPIYEVNSYKVVSIIFGVLILVLTVAGGMIWDNLNHRVEDLASSRLKIKAENSELKKYVDETRKEINKLYEDYQEVAKDTIAYQDTIATLRAEAQANEIVNKMTDEEKIEMLDNLTKDMPIFPLIMRQK